MATSQCFLFDPAENAWDSIGLMAKKRADAKMVKLEDEHEFLIAGGEHVGQLQRTTEIFNARTGRSRLGFSLPEGVSGHCLIKVRVLACKQVIDIAIA